MTSVDVDEITSRLTRRFGPPVAGWCARVPDQAAEAAARWDLTLGDVMPPGASSVVVACERDGVPSALKLSPDPVFLAEQASALRHFAPSGRVPAVLAEAGGVLLMAAVRPGTPADDLPTPPSPGQWADLYTALHSVPDRDHHSWLPLRARCEEAFTRIGRRLSEPAVATHITARTWTRALHRCRALLDTQPRVRLHGDLHLGNVLDGDHTLMAIDPRPCVGDPCFDVVDYALAAAGHEGVTTRATAVAEAASLDPDRLHEWCRALAPMIAIAHLTDDATRTELLTLAR